MLAKRIIPCLDVKEGRVVKGVQFRGHENVGAILALAARYVADQADELVFYDITASSGGHVVSRDWIEDVSNLLDIPFCVAGGIRTLDDARTMLASGADKISINSPALENPDLIDAMSGEFGRQCMVVGIDSRFEDGDYWVYQYTGDEKKTVAARRRTLDWVAEVVDRGAGEIVLNCINQDGMRQGYDLEQLQLVRARVTVPLIASGGAGSLVHFRDAFLTANVDGALAASVFHKQTLTIPQVKTYLKAEGIEVRQS